MRRHRLADGIAVRSDPSNKARGLILVHGNEAEPAHVEPRQLARCHSRRRERRNYLQEEIAGPAIARAAHGVEVVAFGIQWQRGGRYHSGRQVRARDRVAIVLEWMTGEIVDRDDLSLRREYLLRGHHLHHCTVARDRVGGGPALAVLRPSERGSEAGYSDDDSEDDRQARLHGHSQRQATAARLLSVATACDERAHRSRADDGGSEDDAGNG